MQCFDSVYQARTRIRSGEGMRVLLQPCCVFKSSRRFAVNESLDLANGPRNPSPIPVRIENAPIADRLPNSAGQQFVILGKEVQGQNDILKYATGLSEILLEDVRPSEFDNSPAARLS